MPRRTTPPAESTTLRLKENAYVNGTLAFKGAEFTFPTDEADRRLAKTQYWEQL